ncbi:MAG: phosphoribosylformylglycinamidine synthase subunit PurS [Chloroflexota bacterium]
MRLFLSRVYVTSRASVRDPEGETIFNGLRQLGYAGVQGVRAGRYFELRLEASDADAAAGTVERLCRELLANPVIEDFRFELEENAGGLPSPAAGSGGEAEGAALTLPSPAVAGEGSGEQGSGGGFR